MEVAQEAYTLFNTNDSKSTRLPVACEANRLLAVYLWLRVEKEQQEFPGIIQRGRSLYSRALCTLASEEREIVDLKTLKSVKNIGPKISKDVVENLWKYYPPTQTQETKTEQRKRDPEIDPETQEKCSKTRTRKKAKREYKPARGTANYTFLLTLLHAFEQDEDSLSKLELMSRAEASGLCNGSIYGNDPILQKKLAQKTSSPIKLFCYSGWNCVKTMTEREMPLVETFSCPKRIKLTEKGIEIAKELRSEAMDDGTYENAVFQNKTLTEEAGETSTTGDTLIDATEDFVDETLEDAIEIVEPLQLPFLSQDSRFNDEFEVVLVIDQREQFSRLNSNTGILSRTDALALHLDPLEKSGISVSIRQLEIGDAMWIAKRTSSSNDESVGEEFVLDFIIERKRVDDLASSIIDKRYEQQKYWLKSSGLKQLLYVVEGDQESLERGKAIKTATEATEIFQPFQVFKTRNYNDTLKLYSQITEYIKTMYSTQDVLYGDIAMTYEAFKAKLSDKRKLKYQDVWGLMLTRVPGIGPDSVASIVRKYPTPLDFYSAFRNLDEEQIQGLANLKILGGRKFGLVKAKKLINCLLNKNL